MSIDSELSKNCQKEVLERISDGFLALDASLEVVYVNSAAAAMLKVDHDRVVGEHVETTLETLTDSALFEHVEAALSNGETATFEETVQIQDAVDPRTVRVEGTVYPSGDGVSILLRDVTERTRIRQARERQAAVLERLHDVASDLSYSRDEKIQRMLAIGTDYLGVKYGFVTRIDNGVQEITHSVGDHSRLEIGSSAPLSETYCQYTLETGGTLDVSDAASSDRLTGPEYERFGLECYLGVVLSVDGHQHGTVCFADSEPRSDGFDEHERAFVELLADWLTLMLERQRSERELEHQQAFTESLLNSLPDPVYAFDESGALLRWNDRFEQVTGYSADELVSGVPETFVAAEDREKVAAVFDAVFEGERVSVEATLEADGTRTPYELSGAPLYDSGGDIIGATGVGRDITEQYAHRERLSTILETTRSLMQARDRQHVGELATNAIELLMDEDITVFRLYDSECNTLKPVAMTPGVETLMGERPVYEVGEGYPGEVFASGEPTIVDDFATVESTYPYGEARSAMYYPVGVHGTITVGSTEPNAFDETDQHVLALLATSAAAACMRAKRMQELREAREHTERVLDRVNGLVQNTVEVLVHARTRAELEAGVVEELAAADPYEFAWIGQPDVTSDQLVPTAWGGAASLSLEGHSFALSGDDGPVATTYAEGTTQVIPDLHARDDYWGDIVADSGVTSTILIPLVYKEATYGVLSVCAATPDAFDERERVVLEALGRAVANAINAVERGRIFDATAILELEFAVGSTDLLFNRLSAGTEAELESVGTDFHSDGTVRLYVSATNVDTAALLDRARSDHEVIEATAIAEHEDEGLLELVVEDSLLAMLAEHGAVVREVLVEKGISRFTVELPYEAEARELFELVERRYPGTDLLGYHERERPVQTRQEFKAALSDRLTDRQETALRTAYLGGFFDWPRKVDGNELAEAMDISRPTYHQHLRSAQSKVFEELFD